MSKETLRIHDQWNFAVVLVTGAELILVKFPASRAPGVYRQGRHRDYIYYGVRDQDH
jgi:hypothetical protein